MNDNLETAQVSSGLADGAATPAAPITPTEPVAPATPSAPQPDAETQRLRSELARYENDIRAIKSSADKRFTESERNWKTQTENLRKEVQNMRMAGMDDTERKRYETELASERQREIEIELQTARATAQEYGANLQAMQYFLSLGVPVENLVLDQGYDTLFNSGMSALTDELKRLKSSTAPQQPPAAAQPGPTPPTVATTTGVANVKPSWDDLRKRYGSDEQIYRMVEAGQLPGDLIPS